MAVDKVAGVLRLGPMGISVSDIDKSARFYAALGFTAGEREQLPHSAARALGAQDPNATVTMRRLTWGDIMILLLQLHPVPTAKPARGAALQLGLAHLELLVEDVDRIAAAIPGLGGKVLEKTRTTLTDLAATPVHSLFCEDPDGTLIVLVQHDPP